MGHSSKDCLKIAKSPGFFCFVLDFPIFFLFKAKGEKLSSYTFIYWRDNDQKWKQTNNTILKSKPEVETT